MVCKEDVVSWFKSLKSHTRIDVMCNLFNLCLPFELRFLGTCLEDLGKRDFHDLRTTETGANNPSELSSPDLQCISDKRARTKLALYISLLHSCNYACSNGYYKILADVEEVHNLIKYNGVSSADDEVLEELLLIYTLALNHPAFTFEQKLFLGEVFTKLQQEEERRHSVKRTRSNQGSTGMEAVDKLPMQAYPPCVSPEQPPVHATSTPGHLTPAALTGDPLVTMPDHPLMSFHLPYSLMAGYHPTTMVLPPPPADSRTSSPCQSNSPSRAGSPGRPKQLPAFNRPPPTIEPTPKYGSVDQLRRMTDEELREQGFNNQSITQLRTLETKLQTTNGYNLPAKKLPTSAEPEPHTDLSFPPGGPLRRYNSVDGSLNPPAIYYQPSCITTPPCLCVVGYQTKLPQIVNSLRNVALDHSSTSDSASDHSPPDTPSLSLTNDRGPPPVEGWEEPVEERRLAGVGRARGGGRSSRSNPPGIQTLPRGRGHNPPHRRRDANIANGTSDDRKVFSATENGGSGVPYPYTNAPFLPHNQFIQYPTFTSQGLFRVPYHHHPNGDMLYHPPLPPPNGQPFLPARPAPLPHLAFSPLVPPPKISCYNCGSQSHIGTDCPEATIEEITNKGQYRIDYSNNVAYGKPGECSTSQDK